MDKLYEHDRLAEACCKPFKTLREGYEFALAEGVIDEAEHSRLDGVNSVGNAMRVHSNAPWDATQERPWRRHWVKRQTLPKAL